MRALSLLILLSVVALLPCTFAQSAASSTAKLRDANALLAQSKFAEAAAAFESVTKSDASSGAAWFGLGQSLEGLKQPEKAVEAYTKDVELQFSSNITMLYTARAYAAKGDQEQAFAWLAKLSDSSPAPGLMAMMNATSEFASMKGTPRFQQIQAKMKPCSSPEYHRFDFWLGSWEVHSPEGPIVGHSEVTNIQGGCILLENWKSGRGYETGTSFNFFDNRDKKWHQTYYDNSGNFGSYPPMSGDLRDGKMVLITAPGQNPISRWTWYVVSPGKVRQIAEQSSDEGKTWTTTWDSTYLRQ